MILYTDQDQSEITVTMPDLQNNSVAEVIDVMNRLGLNLRIRGSGVVQKQEYPPGTQLKRGQIVEVSFVEMIGD